MNTKTSLIATAAAMAFAGSASAIVTPAGNQTIDIAGSTAGRTTVHNTIIAQLGGVSNVAVRFYKADGATVAAASADGAIYKGTFNSQTVIVRTYWAGSASGVDIVSNQTPLINKLPAISNVASAAPGSSSQIGTGLSGDALFVNSGLFQATGDVVEFGYSDVKQAATPYQSVPLASENNMFVIPFAMYKTDTLADVTNVTNQQLRGLFTGGGTAPKSLFTGNPAHTTPIYAVGRDDDSGTRITFAAETGTGVFTPLNQYTFTVSGSGNTATIATPVATTGTGGYASGSSLRTVLGASGFSCIGYLGLSDGATAATLGAVQLTFNGVAFSQDAVKNGSYTFWSYYQSIISSATTNTTAIALHDSIETALLGNASSDAAIDLDDMKVGRQADGATINF